VDESEFMTDEKFKVSPNWGKHRSKITSGNDEKIPFSLEDIPTHRIGSGSKYK